MHQVKFKLLRQGARLPAKAHASDAGFDLTAPEAVKLIPGVPTKVPLGISCDLGPSIWGQIAPRSGLGLRGVTVLGGVVDGGFRDEVVAILLLEADRKLGQEALILPAGSRVAQLILHPLMLAAAVEVSDLEDSDRGANGLGSTGQ